MGLGVIATGCFGVLLVLYRLKEKEQRARLERAENDMAEVVALFQTMRDILNQQKALAKEFNGEIDRKLSQVKQVLSQSLERNQRLYDDQQQLQQQLDEARAQLDSFQRQLGYTKPVASAPKAKSLVAAPNRDVREVARPQAPVRAQGRHVPSSADAFRELAEELSGRDGGDGAQKAAEAPVAPANPGAARAAFRALLDLGGDDGGTAESDNEAESQGASPMQRRVIEYHEAGMSVAEIAKELGLGKGEVRLMLNLAQHPPEG